ncbi:colicin immunity protein [Catenovulum sediminis]|uniref:Colicin immunity protein n=1 Tax=Catenovulum sediminis TaxID=1740262 RepID=A0ABV1RM17_9ALTE
MFDRNIRYSNYSDFFDLQGNNVMKLTTEAAKEVCRYSHDKSYIVSRIEGGIWHNPGFEMRLDCIWDRSKELDSSPELASKEAVDFIEEESNEHDVFIVSLQSI